MIHRLLRTGLRLTRSFTDEGEKLRPDLVQRLLDMEKDYADARTFRDFSFKEMKDKIPADLWEKITAQDPLHKYPELENYPDLDDILPIENSHLPAHLGRPLILLNERQQKAREMTMAFVKAETKLKIARDEGVDSFPTLTTDDYELAIGLLVAREPIWISTHPKDMQFAQVRNKTWEAHHLYYVADKSLLDFEATDEDIQSEEVRRRRAIAKKRLEEGKSYEFVPGSQHYLEANPKETDPRSVQFAGGNRVFLLLKSKATQKWMFPEQQVFGKRSFEVVKNQLLDTYLLKQLKVHHLGPQPLFVTRTEFAVPKVVHRPPYFQEDLYSMYFDRLKLLFPHSSEEQLEEFLNIRYKMKREKEPVTRTVKGRKTFFFQSVLVSGHVQQVEDHYEDWAWVPKERFSKYLTKDDFLKANAAVTSF